MSSSRRGRLWRRAALVAALGLLAAACAPSDGATSQSADQSVRAARRATRDIERQKNLGPGCQYIVARTEKRSTPPPPDLLFLTDAVASPQTCYDQVLFTFQATGADLPPGYEVEYRKGPFTEGPTNAPVTTLGNAFLYVTFTPAQSVDARAGRPKQTYLGNLLLRLKGMRHIEIVRKLIDGDGTVMWIIGLDTKRPFTVDSYNSPPNAAYVKILIMN